MAYQTGTATSFSNLISTLVTFATANGWTDDGSVGDGSNRAIHKNSVYVQWDWESGNVNSVAMYQSTGFTPAALPGDHVGDSGNGYNTNSTRTDVNLDNERCILDIGDGPYLSYHFFENDASPAYIHVVVQSTAGNYRHFGFGEISKYGTWTGGEYVYGHFPSTGLSNLGSALLDGFFEDTGSDARRAATLRCENLTGQPVGSVWANVWGGVDNTPPDDNAGNDKINVCGGFRSGPTCRSFGMMAPSASTSGLIPMIPCNLFYVDTGNSSVYPLGEMADVRFMNMDYFTAEQEVTISSDTWVIFPLALKADTGTYNSRNTGIAYKKVTA